MATALWALFCARAQLSERLSVCWFVCLFVTLPEVAFAASTSDSRLVPSSGRPLLLLHTGGRRRVDDRRVVSSGQPFGHASWR